MGKVAELKRQRGDIYDQRKAIVELAEKENRDLSPDEAAKFSALGEQQEKLTARIQRLDELDDTEPDEPVGTRKTSPNADEPGRGGVKERFVDDPAFGFKSQREFFAAVHQVDTGGSIDQRLKPLYHSNKGGFETFRQTAGSDEASGGSDPYGGFLVPKSFRSDPLMIKFEGDPTMGRTRRIPMESPKVGIPARVDTSHATSVAGGIIVYRRSETASVTATRAQLGEIELKAESLMGVSYGTEELLSDSPRSFMAMLQASYGDAFDSRHLYEVIWGTGAGQFLGFMNSACLVTINKEGSQVADTIVTDNILKMRSQTWGYGNAIWLANPDCMPQLAKLSVAVGVGGSIVYQFSMQDDVPDRLLGRPIFYSDHMSTVGDLGDIACVNLGEYLEGEYEPESMADSTHVRFIQHERTFKFWKRNDGRPWWTAALTPKKGSNQRSPFVTLQAR